MEKLELKHLAPYLPYGLNWFCLDQDSNEWEELPIVKLYNIPNETLEIGGMDIDISELPYPNGLTIKPILRRLSDLTKEIEFKGETARYHEFLAEKDSLLESDLLSICNGTINITRASYYVIDVLFQEHFDVFGLIEKGLAIDINTLKDE